MPPQSLTDAVANQSDADPLATILLLIAGPLVAALASAVLVSVWHDRREDRRWKREELSRQRQVFAKLYAALKEAEDVPVDWLTAVLSGDELEAKRLEDQFRRATWEARVASEEIRISQCPKDVRDSADRAYEAVEYLWQKCAEPREANTVDLEINRVWAAAVNARKDFYWLLRKNLGFEEELEPRGAGEIVVPNFAVDLTFLGARRREDEAPVGSGSPGEHGGTRPRHEEEGP